MATLPLFDSGTTTIDDGTAMTQKKAARKRGKQVSEPGPEAAVQTPLMVSQQDLFTAEEAEADARALLTLFYYRRVLDHRAIALLYRHCRPLMDFLRETERGVKDFFAHFQHLRGYVDAHVLTSTTQRQAAERYADRLMGLLAGRMRGTLLTEYHPMFPERLRRSPLPIYWLFFHPSPILRLPSPVVAIIGSRRSTSTQLRTAAKIAEGVGNVRGTVVTGLATGADAAAHDTARDSEASLVAVLGSGIAKPYPPNHGHWVGELLQGRGYVLTEVPFDHAPKDESFILRNRIVAALADVVVAVSGGYASGTSHTIRFAADMGVPIVSADPDPKSGITQLVEELGGEFTAPESFVSRLQHEDD
jgi:predicted Rossmann fold nucleotide-binding protein DprA/Smf involved in DNA uptake